MPDRSSGYLAHGDFNTTHIYVDSVHHKLAGCIDFGELRGADPYYDLGHLLLHDGESGRPSLFPDILSGYADVTPLPTGIMAQVRMQAVVIGARALALKLDRPSALAKYHDSAQRRTKPVR